MTLRITILGCGASPGVPRIGNDWGACDPNESRNRRTRCSILIERLAADGGRPTRVLVDTGPDMRAQLLAANVDFIDAVVYTHSHADHTHGIDDLRAFWQNTGARVDTYADAATFGRLSEAFSYCYRSAPGSGYPPILQHRPIAAGVPFAVEGGGGRVTITPFRQIHGDIDTLGLRTGGVAYSCDVSDIPDESLSQVADLDLWILDALRYRPHPSHFSVDEARAWIERQKPRRALLTHMHSDLDYAALAASLPAGIAPAHDGLVVELPGA